MAPSTLARETNMATTWNESSVLNAVDTAAPAPVAKPEPMVKSDPIATSEPLTAPVVKKTSRAKILLPILIATATAIGGVAYAHGLGVESTDDAQVEGHLVNVASRINGQVARVLVKDNQLVEAGETIIEIDDRDLVAKLAGARADLASAEAALAAAKAQLALTDRSVAANLAQAKGTLAQASSGWASTRASEQQARADIAAAESKRALAKLDVDRAESLRQKEAISQAELDARRATFDQAVALVEQAKARLASVAAGAASTAGAVEAAEGRLAAAQTGPEQLDAARASVGVAEARVQQAQAALQLAELNASYTKITAPARGVVSRRSVEPGQMVSPDRPLLALVPPDDVWIVANFKEDQLAEMHPGQSVKIKIDAYGSRELQGHVESISGASGARFALLPPDNASGNFVKVVQRIPVLVRLDGAPSVSLRPGMSAYVTVSTKAH
ncbi:Membrane fusion component of tripartite multidrug resistance system [Minicystis rosea]|nr:Membrane fusion component of tripartite multidrug resistance system [Minicystis rosea]